MIVCRLCSGGPCGGHRRWCCWCPITRSRPGAGSRLRTRAGRRSTPRARQPDTVGWQEAVTVPERSGR